MELQKLNSIGGQYYDLKHIVFKKEKLSYNAVQYDAFTVGGITLVKLEQKREVRIFQSFG
jgi:hypothetical protein